MVTAASIRAAYVALTGGNSTKPGLGYYALIKAAFSPFDQEGLHFFEASTKVGRRRSLNCMQCERGRCIHLVWQGGRKPPLAVRVFPQLAVRSKWIYGGATGGGG